jgi:tetratricopeptide (TPR) repeat protein
MKIIHKKDSFLNTIFPELREGSNDMIISTLEKYYTYGPFKPKVIVEKEWVTIEIDTKIIEFQDADYRKVVALCEKGRFTEAKPILRKLIEINPTNSEYHRIMGQILSDEGDQEEAINCLIDALRWDSKNGYALIMMGNIYAKFKDDIPTAMKFYDQALIVNPLDNISLNNIGANLMQQGKLEEAKKYFWEAVKIDEKYPNTHFALGMIAEMENDFHSAFYSTVQAIKLNKNKDVLYQNSVRQAFEIAKKIIKLGEGKMIFREYLYKLEFECGKEIEVIEDTQIPTAAKMEFAENYNRPKHLIKYNPSYPAYEHLIMHELVHLDFVIEARNKELNLLFMTTDFHKAAFIKGLETTVKKFNKMGVPEKEIAAYCTGLFEGINRQAFNTPVDLFIENFLYNDYSELRPYQFISMYGLIQEGIKAVTNKKVIEISPRDIVSKSKTYNLVNAHQLKELYGIDLLKDFHATPQELNQAKTFYDEYLDYKDNREPAEEYELVEHWAKDLNLEKYFELVDEIGYTTKNSSLENYLESIEKDPYDLESKDLHKQRQMDIFLKSQAKIGTNMAVVMFMVSALQYFKGMSKDKIQKIAFEIAWQGTQGYNPNNDGYRISSIPGKQFSGYHILAYYYVSWMLYNPELVPELQLPYDNEYKLALTMTNFK